MIVPAPQGYNTRNIDEDDDVSDKPKITIPAVDSCLIPTSLDNPTPVTADDGRRKRVVMWYNPKPLDLSPPGKRLLSFPGGYSNRIRWKVLQLFLWVGFLIVITQCIGVFVMDGLYSLHTPEYPVPNYNVELSKYASLAIPPLERRFATTAGPIDSGFALFDDERTLPPNRTQTKAGCVETWADILLDTIGRNSTLTSAEVQAIVSKLNLSPSVTRTTMRIMQDSGLLDDNTIRFSEIVSQIRSCVAANQALASFACLSLRDEEVSLKSRLTGDDIERKLRYYLTYMIVVEAIMDAAEPDAYFSAVFRTDLYRQNRERVMHTFEVIEKEFSMDMSEFLRGKYYSVQAIVEGSDVHSVADLPYTPDEIRRVQDLLRLNILEAAELDYREGNEQNAVNGLKLASAVYTPPYISENSFKWPLGKDWVDTYMSWNLAFVLKYNKIAHATKLLTPSVMCTNTANAEDWAWRRGFSLFTFLNFYYNDHTDLNFTANFESEGAVSALATITLKESEVTTPTQSILLNMFDSVNTAFPYDSSSWMAHFDSHAPGAWMSASDVRIFGAVLMSVALVLAGIGLELIVGSLLVRQSTSVRFKLWVLAETMVPVFLPIAIYAQSTLGAPFLLLGVFKFGFPETIEGVASQRYTCPENPSAISDAQWKRIDRRSWINSVATLLHHTLTAYVVVALYTGALVMNTPLALCLLALVLQHLLVPLKYIHQLSFIVGVVLVEIFFEWQVVMALSIDEKYFVNSGVRGVGLGMILAHWMWFALAILKLLDNT